MTRYTLTDADRAKGRIAQSEWGEAWKMRRQSELALLERLRAEAAMPEWYPER